MDLDETEHGTQVPKVVFVNTDGRVCLAPSLSWFSKEFHIGKGVISEMTKQKRLSYKNWYYVDKYWLPAVYNVLGKPAEWFPGATGVYQCDPNNVLMLIQNLNKSCPQKETI